MRCALMVGLICFFMGCCPCLSSGSSFPGKNAFRERTLFLPNSARECQYFFLNSFFIDRLGQSAFVPQLRDYSGSFDSLAPAHFGLSAQPIYVARTPAAPFASRRREKLRGLRRFLWGLRNRSLITRLRASVRRDR